MVGVAHPRRYRARGEHRGPVAEVQQLVEAYRREPPQPRHRHQVADVVGDQPVQQAGLVAQRTGLVDGSVVVGGQLVDRARQALHDRRGIDRRDVGRHASHPVAERPQADLEVAVRDLVPPAGLAGLGALDPRVEPTRRLASREPSETIHRDGVEGGDRLGLRQPGRRTVDGRHDRRADASLVPCLPHRRHGRPQPPGTGHATLDRRHRQGHGQRQLVHRGVDPAASLRRSADAFARRSGVVDVREQLLGLGSFDRREGLPTHDDLVDRLPLVQRHLCLPSTSFLQPRQGV